MDRSLGGARGADVELGAGVGVVAVGAAEEAAVDEGVAVDDGDADDEAAPALGAPADAVDEGVGGASALFASPGFASETSGTRGASVAAAVGGVGRGTHTTRRATLGRSSTFTVGMSAIARDVAVVTG